MSGEEHGDVRRLAVAALRGAFTLVVAGLEKVGQAALYAAGHLDDLAHRPGDHREDR